LKSRRQTTLKNQKFPWRPCPSPEQGSILSASQCHIFHLAAKCGRWTYSDSQISCQVTARDLAILAETSPGTIRRHLRSLSRIGYASHTSPPTWTLYIMRLAHVHEAHVRQAHVRQAHATLPPEDTSACAERTPDEHQTHAPDATDPDATDPATTPLEEREEEREDWKIARLRELLIPLWDIYEIPEQSEPLIRALAIIPDTFHDTFRLWCLDNPRRRSWKSPGIIPSLVSQFLFSRPDIRKIIQDQERNKRQ
jgi:hypothetical protein